MATQLGTTGNNGAPRFVRLSNQRSSGAGSPGMDTDNSDGSEVLEFEHGVRAYPPRHPDGYWRIRWEEDRRRRDTTARNRADAIAKATDAESPPLEMIVAPRLSTSVRPTLSINAGSDLPK